MMRYASLFLKALGYTAPYFWIEVLSGFVKLLVWAIGVSEGAGASHFCRVALIPQPLLPRREKGGRIKVPLPP